MPSSIATQHAESLQLTAAQVSCLIFFSAALVLWLYSEYIHFKQKSSSSDSIDERKEFKLLPVVDDKSTDVTLLDTQNAEKCHSSKDHGANLYAFSSSSFYRCVQLDPKANLSCKSQLRCIVELGAILLWFFIADRTQAIAAGEKTYSRDLFVFLFVVLTAVAAGYSLNAGRSPVLLHRHQTEEWKGWMQVLFLLYHFYNAKEAYNAIRVFIAAYVWMTGFGNFAYYYKTSDFSLGRFVQMMWRLNFLVCFVCLALNNSYMLYYICPMHTIFTVLVYAALGLGWQYNKIDMIMWAKMLGSFVTVFFLWDLKPVFYTIWRPFKFFVGYSDPRRPTDDVLHEWYFRSSLDRYIWIYGMLCAFMHPTCKKILQRIDNMQPAIRRTVRLCATGVALCVGYFWYTYIYTLPKLDYNKLHPYTSWIPITVYIVLRNLTPPLRLWSMGLYGWLGCITLETYIGQFHTWMLTKADDGQPIFLLTLLPGYPLLNFALVTSMYAFISYRLFHVTNDLKTAIIPHDDNRLLLRNAIIMGGTGAAIWAASYFITSSWRLI